jgi:RNA polymerase sigma-70 factor (ECF subfamily)
MKGERSTKVTEMSNRLEALSVNVGKRQESMEQAARLENQFDHYFARIFAYALYRLRDPDKADEVTAQTFTAAIASIQRFDPSRGSFDAWLFGIARNVIRKHLRSERIRRWITFDALFSEPATPMRWVEEIAANNEMLAKLLPLLSNLSERERDILSLKFGAQMTNRDIAETTGLSPSHVGVILYRTLHDLRDRLQEEDENG